MTVDFNKREKQSMLAVKVGLVTNVFLAVLKTSVGIIGHSPALLADGINSTSDVAYYLVVAAFMKRAGKPPDYEHPYGHRQLESIAALIVGSFVITAAVAIFWTSVNSIYDLWVGESGFTGASQIAVWVATFTVIAKLGLTHFTRRIGSQTSNAAVMALAYDHRNDLFSAVAATIGILLGRMGYLLVDPLAGAIVALFVLRTGVAIVRESSQDLMDTVPGKTLAGRIIQLVQPIPGVEQVEEIHAHRFGPYLVVNVTVGVDGGISVTAGDSIASEVEKVLYQDVDLLRRVYVHYHPSQTMADQPALICEPLGRHQHE